MGGPGSGRRKGGGSKKKETHIGWLRGARELNRETKAGGKFNIAGKSISVKKNKSRIRYLKKVTK